jgi:hypothetical protein
LADQQLPTEDWLLFASTVLGSVGTMATNNPMYYFYGLTLGASSKALLSLGPNWRSWEDWLLFAGAFLGSVGTTLGGSTNYMLYGLILGAIGKAVPSLAQDKRSLEDWFLFVIPLVTGIGSALATLPNLAMLGLFFGMIGKSLGGVGQGSPSATQTTAGATSSAAPQPFGFAGNRNYILWNGCAPLVNPSVAFTAGSDMHASGNWDLQVNAYALSGTDAYMQFVLAVTAAGEVQWSIENWPVSGDNLFNTCDHLLCELPSSFLPKGYSVGVKMNTDPKTSNVVSVEFSVSDATGALVASRTVPLDSSLPLCNGSWKESYLSQVIGFEPNLVGYNGGVVVSFSSGCAGTLACSAVSISASSSIPGCAETKAGTVESSNLQYSPANQASQSLVTIGVFAP